MIQRIAACIVVLLVCCVSRCAFAAEVRAFLDRTSMHLGETVTLNIEVSGDSRVPQPDFSALRQDFDLLGTQSSNSVNIVNGQTSSKMLWAIGLQPKHEGTLTIPALDVAAQRTQVLTLDVQPAAQVAGGKSGDDVFLEVSAEPRNPYVQQQVQFTTKLYFAVNFSDAGLADPQADGLTVRKLGQDAVYVANVGGRRYQVQERRYAMTPQKSGPIVLAPIRFQGHSIDPADINSFFNRGRAVAIHSEGITLDVRPRPAASGSDAWLPARALTLSAEGIDAQTAARVGEPLTLTVLLKAQGLSFEQLPELKLPKIDGADVYPDKTTTLNRDDGQWVYGQRERKFAIVPNRAGQLTLPALSLAWWDTEHDRAASADLAALTLTVEPAAATALPAPRADAAAPTRAAIEDNVPALGTSVADALLWRNLAVAAFALWVLTVALGAGWLMLRRRPKATPLPPSPNTSAAAQHAAFRACVQRADWPAAARALLSWARTRRPGLRNLGDLARALSDPAQSAAARELDSACYGSPAISGLSERLTSAFHGDLCLNSVPSSVGEGPLPPLYPSHN